MDPLESERRSALLSQYMDIQWPGTREAVDVRRKGWLIQEAIVNPCNDGEDLFYGGSRSEGIESDVCDTDMMFIDNSVLVTYRGETIPPSSTQKTILCMGNVAGDCRPGYVSLQLYHQGQRCTAQLQQALVPIGESIFVSSDMYREDGVRATCEVLGTEVESNGPSTTWITGGYSVDMVDCFPCNSWPKEASEWITRTRLYGWPPQTLIDSIIHSGCHLVPVGDKCSDDTFLQWRISLIMAERRLSHSLSHIQFKVYCLLKIFLTGIKPILRKEIGDDDILCSYFLKTAIFFAVENSHKTLWQEKHIFTCFWFCFNILVAWVKAGFCPNYFIPTNNMFKRKIHGRNQQKLLDILRHHHQQKWTSLLESLQPLRDPQLHQEIIRPKTAQEVEYKMDVVVLQTLAQSEIVAKSTTVRALEVLLKSRSEADETISYYHTVCTIANLFKGVSLENMRGVDNKTRYRTLRAYKQLMMPRASLGTELLYLATFYFQTGNYSKSNELCKYVGSPPSFYLGTSGGLNPDRKVKYMQDFCQQGYTLIHKLKTTLSKNILLKRGDYFCVPLHLQLEASKSPTGVYIPPKPYAVFLSFLCSYELGSTRGCDAALQYLMFLTNDDQQGGHKHWVVYTLLGICYQTLCDSRRAIKFYWDSLQAKSVDHQLNPAMERIAVVYLVMCHQVLDNSRG